MNVERFSLAGAAHGSSRSGTSLGAAPVSEKRIGLNRGPDRQRYGRRTRSYPLRKRAQSTSDHRASDVGCGLATFWSPTPSLIDHRRPKLSVLQRVGRASGRCGASIRTPSWWALQCHAAGVRIPGHDVSGTGWQIMGRPMPSITPWCRRGSAGIVATTARSVPRNGRGSPRVVPGPG